MRPFALLPLVALAGCDSSFVSPIRAPEADGAPAGVPDGPAAPPADEPAPPASPDPPDPPTACMSSGHRVFDEGAWALAARDGRLIVGGIGLHVEQDNGSFLEVDDTIMWRFAGGDEGPLFATTLDSPAWTSFRVARFDGDAFARTDLLSSQGLMTLGANAIAPRGDGLAPWALPADIQVVGDELLLTTWLAYFEGTEMLSDPVEPDARLVRMPAGGGTAENIAVIPAAGNMIVDGARVWIGGLGLVDVSLTSGDVRVVYDSLEGIPPEHMTQTDDAIYMTSSYRGEIGRFLKDGSEHRSYTARDDVHAHELVVHEGHVYWVDHFFHGALPGRLMRVSVDGGDPEVVASCIPEPLHLLLHDGVIDVATYAGVYRFPVPEG